MNNDSNTTLKELKAQMAAFVKEREWHELHNAKSLSMAIAVEAGELMEKFIWTSPEESAKLLETNREEIEEEVADVFALLMAFANAYNIDLSKAFMDKMVKNAKKYPAEASKGDATKYIKLRKKP